MGRLDDAITRIQEAQALDPASVSINRDAAVIMHYRREYDRVIQQCHQTLELNSEFWGAFWVLGLAYQAQSRFEEAIAAFRQRLSLSGGSPRIQGALGHVYGLANDRESAQKVIGGLAELATTRYVSPFETGYIYAGIGEIEIAVEWFRKAASICCFDMIAIAVDPRFDRVREHPRFKSLLQQIQSAHQNGHGTSRLGKPARSVAYR
jgi:tetratricopeptide (TPR) repeat protein